MTDKEGGFIYTHVHPEIAQSTKNICPWVFFYLTNLPFNFYYSHSNTPTLLKKPTLKHALLNILFCHSIRQVLLKRHALYWSRIQVFFHVEKHKKKSNNHDGSLFELRERFCRYVTANLLCRCSIGKSRWKILLKPIYIFEDLLCKWSSFLWNLVE